MEPTSKRRNPLAQFVPILASVALFAVVLLITNLPGITHAVRQHFANSNVQHAPPTTTDNVLKSLGYVEVNPATDDALVPFVARTYSPNLPAAVSVFANCGYMDKDVCDQGYPAFSTSRYPVVFVADDRILAMLGEVHYTQDTSRIALVSGVPVGWQDLAQLDSDQRQQMLRAMPTIELATSRNASENTVTVPPFNIGVTTVWLDLSSLSHPVA